MTPHDRILGSMLASACGDALGAPLEFHTGVEIRYRMGRVTDLGGGGIWLPGETTDDTALLLATAQAYTGKRSYDPARAGEAMARWSRGPIKDIGAITAAALRMIGPTATPGSGWCSAGEAVLKRHPGAAGNGSLMRCAPTGLVRKPDDPRLVEEALELSRITHADPRCQWACAAYCLILSVLVDGGTGADAIGAADERLECEARADLRVRTVIENARAGWPPFCQGQPIGYVLLAFERALYALVRAEQLEIGNGVVGLAELPPFGEVTPLEYVLCDVANEGGDADTNAAIAGGLLGARFGRAAIPPRWQPTNIATIEFIATHLGLLRTKVPTSHCP